MIKALRSALAVRHRSLYPVEHANPAEVLVAECGRGYQLVMVGTLPEHRLPIESDYGALILKNGFAIGYGVGAMMFEQVEIAINIFDAWRGGEAGLERSLFFSAYARNKRCIALDLHDEEDREHLRRLVSGADFLIESEPPGRMQALGLGYDELAQIQPGLVYVSITAFWQTGPKADWASSDLTQMAAGGFAYLTG